MVPKPAVIPNAKVVKPTLILLVMMALEASGLMPTIEWVHISWRSMVSTICGPRIFTLKSGFWYVKMAPTPPAITKIRTDNRECFRFRRKIAGKVVQKNEKIAEVLALRPE